MARIRDEKRNARGEEIKSRILRTDGDFYEGRGERLARGGVWKDILANTIRELLFQLGLAENVHEVGLAKLDALPDF